MPFQTPNSIASRKVFYCAVVPENLTRYFYGCLFELVQACNWEQAGSVTVDSIQDAMFELLLSVKECRPMQIGDIMQTANDGALPDFALPCNGSAVQIVDYPDLYTAIHDTFGSAPDGYFKLPDLQAKFPLGAGSSGLYSYSLGDVGGETVHTLSTLEVPVHAHSEITAVSTVINGGIEAPAAAAVPGFGNTGTSGGGEAHNNMPPYLALRYYIVAK